MWDVGTCVRRHPLKQIITMRVADDQGKPGGALVASVGRPWNCWPCKGQLRRGRLVAEFVGPEKGRSA
jgi:hypothetical protein